MLTTITLGAASFILNSRRMALLPVRLVKDSAMVVAATACSRTIATKDPETDALDP